MKKIISFLCFSAASINLSAGPVEDVIKTYTSNVSAHENGPDHNKHIALCLSDEKTVSQIESSIFVSLKEAIVGKDFKTIISANADQIANFKKDRKASRETEGVREYDWTGTSGGRLTEHLKAYSSVEYADVKVVDYKINPNKRTAKNNFDQLSLTVKIDIRGYNAEKMRMHDRFQVTMDAEKSESQWKIAAARLEKGSSLVQTRMPAFEDITASSGLDKVNVSRRTEAIRRGGYALAVIDYNRDGIQDLFVGHRDNAEVFIGSKDGKFSKIATPFDNEKFTKTAVFADFSNSGKQDAVINRFIATNDDGSKKVNEQLPTQVAFYKNTEKGFVEQGNMFGPADIFKAPMPSAVGDFNEDGLLDIYIGYPGAQDFSQLGDPTPTAKKFQGLYLNDGKGGFIDSTEKLNFSFEKFQAKLYPHSSLAVDLNQDQKLDLVVLDDRGNLSPAFVNMGKGFFRESSEKIGILNYNFAMGITSGDLNNDGAVDIGLTNVNFGEMDRLNRACDRHLARRPFGDNPGLRLYTAASSPKRVIKFIEVDAENFDEIGEGAGGVTFVDYNNDGHLDIYVVNGLWSGTSKGQNLGAFFVGALRMNTEKRSMYTLNSRNNLRFMDVLSEFKGTVADYADANSISKSSERPSLAGYQRNRLLRNNGNGTFTDVGYMEGIDSIADGYIVGKLDYNKDGVMDLVLRNADPGTDDYKFPAVQLMKNNMDPKKSVILTFRGTNRDNDGIGLFVKAYAKKWKQVQHLEGNSGSMQQQRLVHFGLGKNKKLDSIEIFWPSGVKQVIKNVGPGYHEIVEPPAPRMVTSTAN
jgi:hypothetical protein